VTGVPPDSARDVPDISFSAAVDHDGYLVCSQSSCVNGYRLANNNLTVVGGTSAGAPILAGVVALLNQQYPGSGSTQGQGNLNTRLYALAMSSTDAFHDIVSGDNIVPCKAGSISCPSTGQIGFTAGPGYDQVTGLGTPNVYNLFSEWAPGSQTSTPTQADFAFTAPSPSSLSLKSSQSGNATVSLSALNGFNGSATISCLAQFLGSATCTVTPSTAGPSASVTATVTAPASSSVPAAGLTGYLVIQGQIGPTSSPVVSTYRIATVNVTISQ
jgi:hypothetical protein